MTTWRLRFPARSVTIAFPGRSLRNVVDDPLTGDTLPPVADHAANTTTGLPNASAPVADSRCVAPGRSVALLGVTASVASGPGLTVTSCSAPALPTALAESVAVPAFVSR